MTKAKQKIAAIVVAATCMSFGIAGTLAYISGSSVSHNVIETAPGVNLSVEESYDETITPGATFSNTVKIKAGDSSATAWVRVKVDKSITVAEGSGANPDPDLISVDINQEDWEENSDGWLYYKKKLAAGEETAPIFSRITFDGYNIGNPTSGSYTGSKFTVSVKVQGVQVANNGAAVSEATGWPAGN